MSEEKTKGKYRYSKIFTPACVCDNAAVTLLQYQLFTMIFITISLNVLHNERRHSADYFFFPVPNPLIPLISPAPIHSPGSLDCLSESKVQGCHLSTLLLCVIWVRPQVRPSHKAIRFIKLQRCCRRSLLKWRVCGCVIDKGLNKNLSLRGLSFSCWPRCTHSLLCFHCFWGHFITITALYLT